MRILLQQLNTDLYFQEPGVWTGDVNAALDFGDTQRAIDYAKSQNMTDVRVVATFKTGGYLDSIAYPVYGTRGPKIVHARA